MDRDWDESMSRPPVGSGSFPPSAVPRVRLPLLVWVPCFIIGVANAFWPYDSDAALALILAEFAFAAILVAVVVWLWLPRPRKWQRIPALAWVGILLGAHLLVWPPCLLAVAHPGFVTAVVFVLAEMAVGALLAAIVVRPRLPGPGEWQWEPALALLGILLGAFLGAVAVMSYGAGVFLPYLAGWGGLELEELGGGDFSWQDWLVWFFLVFPVCGAVVCGASGYVAWALRFLRPDQRRQSGQI